MGLDAAGWIRRYLEKAECAESDRNDTEKYLKYGTNVPFDQMESVIEECRKVFADFNQEQDKKRLDVLRPWRDRVEKIYHIALEVVKL